MAQLILALLLAATARAEHLTLEGYAWARLRSGAEFEKTEVGGLSALVFQDDKLFLLSDDRGKFSPSRFYEATLSIKAPKAELKITAVHRLSGVPGLDQSKTVLDPEGLVRLPDGSLLVTSESDTNRKPREKNRLIKFAADGKFLTEYDFPADEQPEPTGRQTRGTVNNAGPEGATRCANGDLWIAMERPLVSARDERARIERWSESGGKFKSAAVHYYEITPKTEAAQIMRGISDILCLEGGKFLVMERTAVIAGPGIGTEVQLFEADCSKDVCTKKLILDARRDLDKLRGNRAPANFEGLSWGPDLPDGRRSVLMVSDNNFRSDETELVVFAVKEGP